MKVLLNHIVGHSVIAQLYLSSDRKKSFSVADNNIPRVENQRSFGIFHPINLFTFTPFQQLTVDS